MGETPKHIVMVKVAELLAVTAGRIDGRPVAIVTIRSGDGSFAPVNLAFRREQAARLLVDLSELFETSSFFKE